MMFSFKLSSCFLALSLLTVIEGVKDNKDANNQKQLDTLFNTQVKNEFLASNIYLTFAHKLSTRGTFQGFASFFFESAEEEREHGKKLIEYYNVRNIELNLHDIVVNDTIEDIKDLPTMIRTAKILEDDVFGSMNEVRTAASIAKDYATIHFIEKEMLEEQTLAVKYMHDLVKRIERNSDSYILLQMLDQDLRKKQLKKA